MLKTVSTGTGGGTTGGVVYQGTWNASTNTPTLTSSVGTKGYYYLVSVAGSTNLNGITTWNAGDWAVFDGSVWERVIGGTPSTTFTLGNTVVTLGGTTTNVGNLTLANANITSVAQTFPNSYLSNSTTTLGNATLTLGSTTSTVGNLTVASGTFSNANITSVAVTFPNSYLSNSSVTIGNTSVSLGSTVSTFGNVTLNNVTINNVATTFPNSFLSNSSATIGNTTVTLGSTVSSIGNLTLSNVTISSGSISNVAITSNLVTKTANYSAAAGDETILANASTGNVTITLPTAASISGKVYIVKKIDSTANSVIIATTSSQTIDGNTTRTFTSQYTGAQVQSDGSNWYILAWIDGRNGTAGTF